MAKMEKVELNSIEPYDLSFAEVRPDKDWKQTVQKIAIAINVQFTESSQQDLPFVPYKEFPNLLREEKVFLFGPSGCGKSRTIIEMIRKKEIVSDNNYERIFIISPSNPAGIGTQRENLSSFSSQFGQDDLVVWDNFPEGLVKRDLQSAFGALEIINSRSVRNVYIALKPAYLEMYRGLTLNIPDIYSHEVAWDLETMKALLKAYGKDVKEYREIFEKYVSQNIDKIAKILWQKQPLSLTVVDFYKALLVKMTTGVAAAATTTTATLIDKQYEQDNKYWSATLNSSAAAIMMAEEWLPVHDYFERQFEVMKDIKGRQSDVDFLYTLKFCYEAGFDRTHDSIASLQKEIFGTNPPIEPTRKMATWIYLSGQNYSMHDSAKNAIRLSDYSKMRIISYLSRHFSKIVPRGDGELYSLGLFLGRNIHFGLSDVESKKIVPGEIFRFMKTNAIFERAIGRGVGENFELLEDLLQDLILKFIDTEIEFGVGLADSLGERFVELDESNRERILEKAYHGMVFARYLGQSIGRLYVRLSGDLRHIVLTHAEKNPQFADGLGMGLGYVFASLDSELQKEITLKAQKSIELSRGVGLGFGLRFALLPTEEAKQVMELADKNSELDMGFGMGLATEYSKLSGELRKLVLDRAAKDSQFAFGVGIYGAFAHRQAVSPDIFCLLGSNGEIAYGLGLGFGVSFFYLPAEFQSKLHLLTKSEIRLDDGLGSGIGMVLKHLPLEVQETLLEKALAHNSFSIGLGYGLGFTWHYVSGESQKRALKIAGSNNEFARGLGIGLGTHIDYLKPAFFDDIIAFANTNSEFNCGFGIGAAFALPYCSDEVKKVIRERVKTTREFARGLGFGLARIFRHLSSSEREQTMRKVFSDAVFAEGFGEGTGHYLWSVSDETDRKQFVESAFEHPEISRGLGSGTGFVYSYFVNDLYNGSLKPLFEKDPYFRYGVGRGMGRAFAYLTGQARTEAFRIAEEDVDFATGLGEGLGIVYIYLDRSQRELIMGHIGGEEANDTGFSKGFGIGLGSIFSYFQDDMKNEILTIARNNRQFAKGFGIAVVMHAPYLSEVLRNRIFDLAKNNPCLAIGLGEGCGLEFLRLFPVSKKWLISSNIMEMDEFVFGVGFGIGRISRLLDETVHTEAREFFSRKEAKFSEGYATGFASTLANLSDNNDNGNNDNDLFAKVLSKAQKDDDAADFTRSLGFGLGHVFSMLTENKRSKILEIMGRNEDFLTGLGAGVGYHLNLSGGHIVEYVIRTIPSKGLRSGLALGIAASFKYLHMPQVLGVIEYTNSMPEYGKVLGEKLAERFASFDDDKQVLVLAALQRDTEFARHFSNSIERNISYLSSLTQERIKILQASLPHLNDKEKKQNFTEQETIAMSRKGIEMIMFDAFPLVGISTSGRMNWNIGKGEIAFSGTVQQCCVCFVDIIGSTVTSSGLSADQLSRYYEIFLNGIARIAENFGAKIVKNTGDALIFYFDNILQNSDDHNNDSDPVKGIKRLKNVLDCCLTMSAASGVLNAKMLSERLPPVQYRISADYGELSIAKSSSSQSEDLFGSAMNICAKMNSKALPNGLIIGQNLFDRVSGMSEYTFIPDTEKLVVLKGEYNVYHVEKKEKRPVINPFERRPLD
jgi:class 3 adenylate cyclase